MSRPFPSDVLLGFISRNRLEVYDLDSRRNLRFPFLVSIWGLTGYEEGDSEQAPETLFHIHGSPCHGFLPLLKLELNCSFSGRPFLLRNCCCYWLVPAHTLLTLPVAT